MIKPQTLKGFRDFLPKEKIKRDYLLQKIKQTFEQFGFEPIETPTLEKASLLLGKYGQEADKLVYSFKDRGQRQVALRYDQTVPTARVLAQYQSELPNKGFRRYQIQNVFRADKPQKGRYREFTHCDIDIFGVTEDKAIADAEILACTYSTFKNIGFPKITIKINDRQALFQEIKLLKKSFKPDTFSIIQSIDKLSKIGSEKVIAELVDKGLNQDKASKILKKIQNLKLTTKLEKIINYAQKLGVPSEVIKLDSSLARGLDYYTGMIFEVTVPEYDNSLCGGGRYDMLLTQLTNIDMPAVGMAIGFDRTLEVAEQLGLIPQGKTISKVLVTLFDQSTIKPSLQLTKELRQAGLNTEIYPDTESGLDKQLKYANKKQIPFVVILGPEEIEKKTVTLKNMDTGKQTTDSLEKIIKMVV